MQSHAYLYFITQYGLRVDDTSVGTTLKPTVFIFPSIGELRQTLLQNIPRKLDKITQSTRVCIKHFEDKDVHSFNIHTNPEGTTYTMSNVVLIKLL